MPYSYKLVSILAAHTYMSDTQKRKMERYIGHYGATTPPILWPSCSVLLFNIDLCRM
jgi:hypothetical protein